MLGLGELERERKARAGRSARTAAVRRTAQFWASNFLTPYLPTRLPFLHTIRAPGRPITSRLRCTAEPL